MNGRATAFARTLSWVVLCGVSLACSNSDHAVQPVAFDSDSLYDQLEPLGRAIGDSRIVLLGENGHGVGEFTEAKVKLVEWLYREHNFDVVAFESGFFECGHVWNRIDTLSSEEAREPAHWSSHARCPHAAILTYRRAGQSP